MATARDPRNFSVTMLERMMASSPEMAQTIQTAIVNKTTLEQAAADMRAQQQPAITPLPNLQGEKKPNPAAAVGGLDSAPGGSASMVTQQQKKGFDPASYMLGRTTLLGL